MMWPQFSALDMVDPMEGNTADIFLRGWDKLKLPIGGKAHGIVFYSIQSVRLLRCSTEIQGSLGARYLNQLQKKS